MSESAVSEQSATARSTAGGRVADAFRRFWNDETKRTTLLAGLVAFVIYEISREPGHQVYDQYVRLADAMIHGRLDIAPAPWLESVVFEGRTYSHQGVLPGIMLIPFVLLFGEEFNLRHFAALLGGGVSMAAWSLAARLGLDGRRRILGWAFPVIGTTIWFESKTGGTWAVAALASVLFLFLSLNEYFGKRRLWMIGLFVGLAGLSRPPAYLALAGYAALVVRQPRKLANLAIGAAGPVLVMFGYNFARFGTIAEKAQEIHYANDGYRHQRPPGMISIRHVPFNLYSWFLLGPQFQEQFPYLKLTILGTALPLTSPAFVSAFGARRERWMWLCALFVVIPAAIWYANGFAQFGIRYLLDAIPFISALVFLALKDDRAPGYYVLLALSIAMNAYGVAFTTVFGWTS